MADVDFTQTPDSPESGLTRWVIGRLTELRDRMRHDVADGDSQLASAEKQAEQKMREARDALRSPQDF